MLAFLNPAALLALFGLLVPVAIHLWNRRPGREVAVGSLRWLAAGANRRLRNLQPEQLWLLLLRVVLLAVLAVAVAGPVWRTAQPTSRGVVLLSAEAAVLPALAGQKSTIDSLRRRGYALRWLAAGFPRVPARAWQQLQAGPANAIADSVAALATGQAPGQAFAWARVQQAAATFPGQPLVVVTSAALRSFVGSHPPLPAAVTWQALPDTASAAWLASAAQTGDSLSLLVGRSNETRTTYRRQTVPKPLAGKQLRVAGLRPLQLRPAGGGFVLTPSAAPNEEPGTGVAAAAMTVDLYASTEYADDARYLEAALRAAGSALAIRPRVRRRATPPPHPEADWTFWLSAAPLPPLWEQELHRQPRQLWLEASGPGVADTARLAAAEPGAAPVMVFRRDARAALRNPETVWADGQGRAILAREMLGRSSVYRLHTRLHPAWSELADDPQLPARLLELLQPEPTDNIGKPLTALAKAETAHDRRALAPAQLPAAPAQPAAARATHPAAPAAFRQTDLRPWLVLLAGLLLLVERLLAHRRESLNLLATA